MKTIVVIVSNGFANARKYDEFEIDDDATEEEIQEMILRNGLKLKTDGRYTFICVKKGE